MSEFKWQIPNESPNYSQICENDVRLVNTWTKMVFNWVDDIPIYDDETDEFMGYESGWEMTPLPIPKLYKDEENVYLFQSTKESNQ